MMWLRCEELCQVQISEYKLATSGAQQQSYHHIQTDISILGNLKVFAQLLS